MSNPIAAASRILGPDFLGPDSYRATFDWLPTDFPGLTLTTAQIEGIQARNEQLVLMLPSLDGTPMTMQNINRKLGGRQKDGSPLLLDTSWYQDEPFYTTEIPKPSWRIVSKTPIGLGHNYQGQTEDLIGYLRSLYPTHMPQVYQAAIQEYWDHATAIRNQSHWQAKAKSLATLQINQLLRHSAPELLLHLALHNAGTERPKDNLLHSQWSWTNSRSSGGYLVDVGNFDSDGAYVNWGGPDDTNSVLGVLPSRSVGL